jgi:hypothetical protein
MIPVPLLHMTGCGKIQTPAILCLRNIFTTLFVPLGRRCDFSHHIIFLGLIRHLQNSTARFSFNGTAVYLYGAKRANHGGYSISIDEQEIPSTFNGSSTPEQFQTLLYGNASLSYGEHHVVLTNVEAPRWMDLDYIVITTGDGNMRFVDRA